MRTVLLVDDSDMVLRLAGFALKKAGYQVITASDGEDGVTQLNGQEIDLLITDLNMPNKDGIALIRQMRSMPYYRFLPAILFMSDPYKNVEENIRNSGATVLFDKDGIKDMLIATVKKMIG
ncbi:response regulator [Mucilaginibacter lacusdianchii]|uniref:response regulator n=1 Tax=Mucilaginibacter lacusdianchii TaxID=2684211 RepID=UPI00131BABD1|nr:response regulator [Mucilaginibacter sp. JXJ CY 39]